MPWDALPGDENSSSDHEDDFLRDLKTSKNNSKDADNNQQKVVLARLKVRFIYIKRFLV